MRPSWLSASATGADRGPCNRRASASASSASSSRLLVAPRVALRGGEDQEQAVARPADFGGQVDAALEQWSRLVVEPELAIGLADRGDELELHLRLLGQVALHALTAAVEQLARRQLPPPRLLGIGAGEDLHQEVAHLRRLGRLGLRPVALTADHRRLAGGARGPGDEQRESERQGADGGAMATDEARRAVGQGVRPRLHRQAVEVALEVVEQLAERLIAPLGLLAQRFEHDGVEVALEPPRQSLRRRVAVGGESFEIGADAVRIARSGGDDDGARSRRLRVTDGALDLERRRLLDPVRPLPGEQAEEQQPQLIDVRGDGDAPPQHLFGARVVGRQHAGEGAGEVRVAGVGLQQLGDAEVEQLHLPLGGDDDVRRLEIAVDDEVLVRVLHRSPDGERELQALAHVEPLAVAVRVDRQPLDELHREVRLAGVGATAVQQACDPRVLEGGEDLALLFEASQRLLGGDAGAQQLERRPLLELAVVTLDEKHRAHAAAADLAQHPPGPYPFALLEYRRLRRGRHDGVGEVAKERPGEECVGIEPRVVLGRELQQLLDLATHLRLVDAFEQRLALGGCEVEGGVEQVVDPRADVVARCHWEEVMRRALRQLLAQPGSSPGPVALHRAQRRVESLGRLLLGHPGEVAALDDARQPLVERREPLQRAIDRQHQLRLRLDPELGAVERQVRQPAAALERRALARVVHQDAPHRPRADGVEVPPVLPVHPGLVHQLDIGLVHQRSRIQRLPPTPAPDLPASDPPQPVIDQRHQSVESRPVAPVMSLQKASDIARVVHLVHIVGRV